MCDEQTGAHCGSIYVGVNVYVTSVSVVIVKFSRPILYSCKSTLGNPDQNSRYVAYNGYVRWNHLPWTIHGLLNYVDN